MPSELPAPAKQKRARILAVVESTLLANGLGLVFTPLLYHDIATYGFLLFVGLPCLVGFLVQRIGSRGGEMPFWTSFWLGSLSLLGFGLGLILTATEGLICLLMALPLGLPGLMLGIWLGEVTGRRAPLAVIFLPLGLAAAADRLLPRENVSEVFTSLDVDASPDRVWQEVLALETLPPPTDPFLRTGVACPVRTEIRGAGVGAERHCTLTTGAMPERITAWEPGRRLTFVALATPPMMKEINPFRETHPPHLKGYYRVLRGDFILEPLPNGRTRLWRATRYAHRFGPAFYWTRWCDFGAERAHRYVLEVVKDHAEASRVATRTSR